MLFRPLLPFIWQVHGLWGVKLIRIEKFLDNSIGIAHSRFLVSLLLKISEMDDPEGKEAANNFA